jgi:Transposase domain (DUF772)
MKPRERRDSGQGDLLRSRLDAILDMGHALAVLARKVDWSFLEKRFGEAYRDGPGQPPLPTRLMAGLTILKYTYNLSDEELCARWVENPYYQFFCGEEFFQHELVLDRSSLTRWRQRGIAEASDLAEPRIWRVARGGFAKNAFECFGGRLSRETGSHSVEHARKAAHLCCDPAVTHRIMSGI